MTAQEYDEYVKTGKRKKKHKEGLTEVAPHVARMPVSIMVIIAIIMVL